MNDLISRRALNNALTNWQMEYAEKGEDDERFEMLGAVIDLVEQMPTIEPKRGEWIPKTIQYKDCVQCSNCRTLWELETNYCPDCGARMDL